MKFTLTVIFSFHKNLHYIKNILQLYRLHQTNISDFYLFISRQHLYTLRQSFSISHAKIQSLKLPNQYTHQVLFTHICLRSSTISRPFDTTLLRQNILLTIDWFASKHIWSKPQFLVCLVGLKKEERRWKEGEKWINEEKEALKFKQTVLQKVCSILFRE